MRFEALEVDRAGRPRAPSRSTTCSAARALVDPPPRGVERVVVVDRASPRSRPGRAAPAVPPEDVDRRVEDHRGARPGLPRRAARRGTAARSSQQREAVQRRTSRGETARRGQRPALHRPSRSARRTRQVASTCPRGRWVADEAVHVVEGASVGQAGAFSGERAREADRGSSRCGAASGRPRCAARCTSPGTSPRPGVHPSSAPSASKRELQSQADAEHRARRAAAALAHAARRGRARAGCASRAGRRPRRGRRGRRPRAAVGSR